MGPLNLTFQQFNALRLVAETGSFAAAARAAGVSQPAISQQIRGIESHYQLKLFHRARKKLQPTPLCLELCDICESIDRSRRAADLLLRQHKSIAAGKLRIGLGNNMPGMSMITRFHRAHPQVVIEVETGSYDKILKAVLLHEVDVGILPEVHPDDRLDRWPLCRNEVVGLIACASPLHLPEDLSAEALAEMPLIFRSSGSSTQRMVDRMFARHGIAPRPILRLDSRDALVEAVAQRLGMGFIWSRSTGRTNGLAHVPLSALMRPGHEYAIRRSDSDFALVDRFIAACAEPV